MCSVSLNRMLLLTNSNKNCLIINRKGCFLKQLSPLKLKCKHEIQKQSLGTPTYSGEPYDMSYSIRATLY